MWQSRDQGTDSSEEGDQDQPIQHVHAVHVWVNIPPRVETYEEWLDQNQLVVHEAKSKAADLEDHDMNPVICGTEFPL